MIHYSFGERDASPTGLLRRALFEVVQGVEERAFTGLLSIRSAGMTVGEIATVRGMIALARPPHAVSHPPPEADEQEDVTFLAHTLRRATREGLPLSEVVSQLAPVDSARIRRTLGRRFAQDLIGIAGGTDDSDLEFREFPHQGDYAASLCFSAAELFALAGGVLERPERDDARRVYEYFADRPEPAFLLALHEDTARLPLVVEGRRLGAVPVRDLVRLAHAAAVLTRPPDWTTQGRMRAEFAVIGRGPTRFVMIPGETSVAVIGRRGDPIDPVLAVAVRLSRNQPGGLRRLSTLPPGPAAHTGP